MLPQKCLSDPLFIVVSFNSGSNEKMCQSDKLLYFLQNIFVPLNLLGSHEA